MKLKTLKEWEQETIDKATIISVTTFLGRGQYCTAWFARSNSQFAFAEARKRNEAGERVLVYAVAPGSRQAHLNEEMWLDPDSEL